MTVTSAMENQERRQKLAQILAEARDWLLVSVRSRVPLYEDAEDIVQDVLHQFTGAYDEIRSLEASSAWLFQAARNRVADFYRKRDRTLEGSHQIMEDLDDSGHSFLEGLLMDPGSQVERRFELKELGRDLEHAIEALPPAQQQVFIWHEIEDRSFKEIQELTGESLNTLLSRKRYAVLSLRKQLKEYYHSTERN